MERREVTDMGTEENSVTETTVKRQCEAVQIFQKEKGERCRNPAVYTVNGRCLCWVHARTAESGRQLEYV